MPKANSFAIVPFALVVFTLPAGAAPKKDNATPRETPAGATMWAEPTDIASRDLFYGPGGEQDAPHGTFTFEKEDLDGTNPKFVVRDQDGVKWKVKLGEEAKPETVASRIVWAVGYYADEDYFLKDLTVQGMPPHLHRGAKYVAPDGSMHNVRLKRNIKGEDKAGHWEWREDPFTDSREWNGLRVLMALINNWDLKGENNKVRSEKGSQMYMVSDLGSSFGTTGRSYTRADGKGNIGAYEKSRFIVKTTPDYVYFRTPSRPAFIHIVELPEYFRRIHLEWIGKRIPRSDAKWMGDLLARLSQEQIQSAFRAAGYSQADVDGFSGVLQKRIGELSDL